MTEENRLGARIRQLREARDMSVHDLAERSQTHEEAIEQLEAGELVPSLAPLLKIARGLDVRLGTLLDDDPHASPTVVRAGQSEAVVRFSGLGPTCLSTLDFFALAQNKKDRHMEPFIIDVHPSVEEECTFSFHEGEEFIYVLAGQIEVSYGNDRYLLAVGDSIYYDSTTAHQVKAAGESDARILAVVYTPFVDA